MYDGGISRETYSAGAGRDVASIVDYEQLKCIATLPLYLWECRLTDEFFHAFATFILREEIHVFGFPTFYFPIYPWCSTRKDLSIDVSITNVGLILTKPGWFFFLGVRTDRHGFGILTWKHVGTQKISTQISKLVVSCRSLYARLMTTNCLL